MQQNILHLYEKARLQSLEAQEVAWLENQAREYPYYSLVYMVLARHHLSNKSTIKNRALQKGAVFALDRGMLKRYLSDVIPRTKVPKQHQPPKKQETPVKQENTKPKAQAAGVEIPSGNEAKISASSSRPSTNSKVANTPPVVSKKETAPGINAYLDMRIKLRQDKYRNKLSEIRKAVSEFAPDKSSPDLPASKPVESPVEQEKVLGNGRAKPKKKKSQKLPLPKKADAKAVNREALPRQKAVATLPLAKESTVSQQSAEYEIGAFSSFTFLEEADQADPSEREIDSTIHLSEAVEIQTANAAGQGPGEIIFEEKDRIVEVTVSPEELEKYFNGRLPVELNFSDRTIEQQNEGVQEKKTNKSTSVNPPILIDPSRKPVVREKEAELIERFIDVEPSISRVSDYQAATGDLSKPVESEDADEWVTETLARIYERQGNKHRAKQIYQKLALIFPEKNNYFASLIAKLK
ncbi:MAG TPA: hypothetical protein ENJ82_15390 [Bacteroidetes bacterium]|nr:hypothetical protein [Bacteroidota bacterium]